MVSMILLSTFQQLWEGMTWQPSARHFPHQSLEMRHHIENLDKSRKRPSLLLRPWVSDVKGEGWSSDASLILGKDVEQSVILAPQLWIHMVQEIPPWCPWLEWASGSPNCLVGNMGADVAGCPHLISVAVINNKNESNACLHNLQSQVIVHCFRKVKAGTWSS